MRSWVASAALASLMLLPACESSPPPDTADVAVASPTASASPEPSPTPSSSESPKDPNPWVTARPAWLGKRVLPPGPSGFGMVKPTPPILRNRRFATTDLFPPPPPKSGFLVDSHPVPRHVLRRSTWRPECPVTPDDLTYLVMSFWGFDHERHFGEMIVHESVADEVTQAFRRLFEARYPIEEMRVVTLREQRRWKTHPTGDTNVTSSFECREATLGSSWSEHAYGLAIDINPFHNPYVRGSLVAPELAGAYRVRDDRPGVIVEGDPVVAAFDAIGWGWGGRWSGFKDYMHFSQSGH